MMNENRTSQRSTALVEAALPDALLTQLQTLAQLECRADGLRQELAALQRQFAHAVPPHPPSDPNADLVGHETVLIAEDQAVTREIAEEILVSFGYQVFLGTSDPRDWPAHHPLDVVLLDVPFMNDRQLARVRRATERCTRLIVTTPVPEGRAREQLREAGVDAFIEKPLHPLELARCVRKVVSGGVVSGE